MEKVQVAIVGCGVAGIATAEVLARHHFAVTIFERDGFGGGLLNVIPDRRFGKHNIERFLTNIKNLGVEIKYNAPQDLNNLSGLLKDFDYVFLAVGTQSPRSIDGINGIFAVDFLSQLRDGKLDLKEKFVAVLGGGNVAIDCATESASHGAKTTVYYRRGREEMKASPNEIDYAVTKGVKFEFNVDFDKWSATHDVVVIALGTTPNLPKNIENLDRVFVVGDAKIGASTIAQAMKNARETANELVNKISLNK